MKLYHGTSEIVARTILSSGIRPLVANTKPTRHFIFHASSQNHIYLTDSNAPFYSYLVTPKKNSFMAVIEIDVKQLDQSCLTFDELTWEHLGRGVDRLWPPCSPFNAIREYRLNWYKRRMQDKSVQQMYGDSWRHSLSVFGSCAYYGRIEVSAITRILFWERSDNPALHLFFPPITSLLQYEMAGSGMRAAMQHLFGDEITEPLTPSVLDRVAFPVHGKMLMQQSKNQYIMREHHVGEFVL